MARSIQNERDVKREVKKLLDKYGYFWWMPPANGYGKSGTSDFHALKNGVFIAIETKFGSNKPTPLQKAFCESILASKGFAFVVNAENLPWLERWLAGFDNAAAAVAAREEVKQEDGADMLNAIAVLTELLR